MFEYSDSQARFPEVQWWMEDTRPDSESRILAARAPGLRDPCGPAPPLSACSRVRAHGADARDPTACGLR